MQKVVVTTRTGRCQTSPQAYAATWLSLVSLTLGGCSNTPTSPSPDRYAAPRLEVVCQPSGSSVTCIAQTYDVPSFGDVQNVTAQATWISSDPSVGTFVEPGLLRATRRGEVEISARYQQFVAQLSSRFLVDPGQPAERLYWVAGIVRDSETLAPLAGATVVILDGYARGAQGVTNGLGSYRIDGILTGEAFTAEASKSGYVSARATYRVDSPIGPSGNPPFLDFTLRPTD